MGASRNPGFFIAVFLIDGEQEGFYYWEYSKLNDQWSEVYTNQFKSSGFSFDVAIAPNHPQMRVKVMGESRMLLATLTHEGKVALSALLLTGAEPNAESELVQMFVESLRASVKAQFMIDTSGFFEGIKHIAERPLMIVIPWANHPRGPEDDSLLRDLGLGLAKTFFERFGNVAPAR